jgi:hypothetical protein
MAGQWPKRSACFFIEADSVPDKELTAITALFAKCDVETLE